MGAANYEVQQRRDVTHSGLSDELIWLRVSELGWNKLCGKPRGRGTFFRYFGERMHCMHGIGQCRKQEQVGDPRILNAKLF